MSMTDWGRIRTWRYLLVCFTVQNFCHFGDYALGVWPTVVMATRKARDASGVALMWRVRGDQGSGFGRVQASKNGGEMGAGAISPWM